jgi:alginate O-acetyltransferase complex protein AlgI
LAERYRPELEGAGLSLETLQAASQDEATARRLGLDGGGGGFSNMWLVPGEGEAKAGAEGVVALAGRLGWGRTAEWLAGSARGMALAERLYAWVARNRLLLSRLIPSKSLGGWDAVLVGGLLLAALSVESLVSAWAWMWVLSGALFLGCKWLSLRSAAATLPAVSAWQRWTYLFGWVGMDAEVFLGRGVEVARPRVSTVVRPLMNLMAGAALLAGAVPLLAPGSPGLAAWAGLWGMILVMHFGLFELLALTWQWTGVNARPIMTRPLQARSLSDFWGRRWNVGFHKIAHRFVYEPVRMRWGAAVAGFAAFVFSGLIHELVISVPASGGYGLPTAYFVLQYGGMWFERSQAGTWLGLRRGLAGWLFTLALTAGPAYWLFHPWFVEAVAKPMFAALGLWH